MYDFSLGVVLESFKKPYPEALKAAAKLGIRGVQIYATFGELAPERTTARARREFLNRIKGEGLCVSALCGDMGMGFHHPELNPMLIEKSKWILELAKELETNVVTTHIGVVPEDPANPRYAVMQDACGRLAEYADSLDAHFAIETGPETSAVLKTFLDGLHSTGVGVNLDPANLVMVTGDDPVQAVYRLKDYIVHTHAKDGRRNYYRSPEEVYGLLDVENPASPSFEELPLGRGQVDFGAYLKALDEIGYHGFLTIEREVGATPEEDIGLAVQFLNSYIKGGAK